MNESDIHKSRATIYDVAQEAGVSKSLVSLVLHGDSRVSDARRERVLAAISKLGYRPSRAAKALAGKSSKTIGVIIEDYSNLWFVPLVAGLRSIFDEAGYQITVSDLHHALAPMDNPLDAFLSMHVDGIVVAVEPSQLRAGPVPIPCVMVGERHGSLSNADVVINDNYAGAREIVGHLLNLGHTEIGHIAANSGPALPRLKAYTDMMHAHGLPTHIVSEQEAPALSVGYRGMAELLAINPNITAVFAVNDDIAAGAIAYLRSIGKSVPADYSVVGFDNSAVSSKFMFDLTTVDQAGEAIGREAAKLILQRIESPSIHPAHVVLPSQLVVRKSTRALR